MDVRREANRLVLDEVHEADMDRIGQVLGSVCEPGVVIGLVGPLGAGKTTLTRSIAAALGVDPSAVSSPTFVLIQEYEGDLPVYHFDVYRLGGPEPFERLHPEDYWDAGGVCLVEWADLAGSCLPPSAWRVTLEQAGPDARRVVIEADDAGVVDRLGAGLGTGN